MIGRALPVLLIAAAALRVDAQAPPPPGFTLTLDGGQFHSQPLVLKPIAPGSCNNHWVAKRDPRIDRLTFCSDYGKGGWDLLFDGPATPGIHVFAKEDEDKEDRNPYFNFELNFTPPGAAAPRRFTAERVEVAVTKVDPPGGRLEGTIRGTVFDNGDRVTVAVTGRFSVVRGKDRVID